MSSGGWDLILPMDYWNYGELEDTQLTYPMQLLVGSENSYTFGGVQNTSMSTAIQGIQRLIYKDV